MPDQIDAIRNRLLALAEVVDILHNKIQSVSGAYIRLDIGGLIEAQKEITRLLVLIEDFQQGKKIDFGNESLVRFAERLSSAVNYIQQIAAEYQNILPTDVLQNLARAIEQSSAATEVWASNTKQVTAALKMAVSPAQEVEKILNSYKSNLATVETVPAISPPPAAAPLLPSTVTAQSTTSLDTLRTTLGVTKTIEDSLRETLQQEQNITKQQDEETVAAQETAEALAGAASNTQKVAEQAAEAAQKLQEAATVAGELRDATEGGTAGAGAGAGGAGGGGGGGRRGAGSSSAEGREEGGGDDNRTRLPRFKLEFVRGTPEQIQQTVQAFQEESSTISMRLNAALDELARKYNVTREQLKKIIVSVDAATQQFAVQADVLHQVTIGTQEYRVAQKGIQFGNLETGELPDLSPVQRQFVEVMGGVEEATQALSKYDLLLSDIKTVSGDAESGALRFTAAIKDAAGATQRMNFYVNQNGELLRDLTTHHRTFFGMVQRNISKVLEWGIATGLVYGSLRKMSDVLRDMVEIEAAMSDIAIATGAAGEELDRYFNTALQVSMLTGTDFADVLYAQQMAIRVAGGAAADPLEANTLFADSMTLAAIAAMDEKEAIDTLAGALRQVGMPLNEGSKLLDKWVLVSQRAGVSIEDLAKSFAITAAAARVAGVSAEETADRLNAIIATMAETTQLSATETGNAVRAVISGLQSEQVATKILEDYGIAVRDINGEMRDWFDILSDIYAMQQTGLLGQQDIIDISNLIGGGVRRGPQVMALIQNWSRVAENMDISTSSAERAGVANEVLTKKMSTLTGALKRLDATFAKLAKDLGTKGGLLDIGTQVINVLTNIIDLVDKLVSALGPAIPVILAFQAALAVSGRETVLDKLGGFGTPLRALNRQFTLAQQPLSGAAAPSLIYGRRLGFGAVAGAAAVASYTMAAPQEYRAQTAATAASGALVGGLVGALIGPEGAMIGAYIGAAIGNAFVENIRRQDIMRALEERQITPQTVREDVAAYMEQAGKGGAWRQFVKSVINTFFPRQGAAGFYGVSEEMATIQAQYGISYAQAQVSPQARAMLLARMWEQGKFAPVTTIPGFAVTPSEVASMPEIAAMSQLTFGMSEEEVQQLLLYGKELNRMLDEGVFKWDEINGQAVEFKEYLEDAGRLEQELFGEGGQGTEFILRKQRELLSQLASGRISPREYQDQFQQLQALDKQTAKIVAVMLEWNKATIDLGENWRDIGTATDYVMSALMEIPAENRQALLTIFEQIGQKQDELNKLAAEGVSITEQKLELEQEMLMAAEMLAAYERQARLAKVDTGFTGWQLQTTPERMQQDIDTVIAYARKLMEKQAITIGLSVDDMIEALGGAEETITIMIKTATEEGLETAFAEVPAYLAQYYATAIEEATADGVIKGLDEGYNFMNLRDQITPDMVDMLQRGASYYTKLLQENVPGYNEEVKKMTIMLADNQFAEIVTTETAMQLVLEDIRDINQKQLEGIWNLPSGANIWVPFQSYFLPEGGADNMWGNYPETEVPTLTDAANTFDNAVEKFGQYVSSMPEHTYDPSLIHGGGATIGPTGEETLADVEAERVGTIQQFLKGEYESREAFGKYKEEQSALASVARLREELVDEARAAAAYAARLQGLADSYAQGSLDTTANFPNAASNALLVGLTNLVTGIANKLDVDIGITFDDEGALQAAAKSAGAAVGNIAGTVGVGIR